MHAFHVYFIVTLKMLFYYVVLSLLPIIHIKFDFLFYL